jgi:hypothetical protein
VEAVDVTAAAAVAFVVLASCMLLLMFFFLNQAFFYFLVRCCTPPPRDRGHLLPGARVHAAPRCDCAGAVMRQRSSVA